MAAVPNKMKLKGRITKSGRRRKGTLYQIKTFSVKDHFIAERIRGEDLLLCIAVHNDKVYGREWLHHFINTRFTWFPDCIKHASVLSQLIHEAKKGKNNLAVVWLDLANAYWSITHKLINKGNGPLTFHIIPRRYIM